MPIPKALRLTDSELDAVFAAARPLAVEHRDGSLRSVADTLANCGELGPGLVARVCAEQQRLFFHPPDLDCGHVPRWSSRRRNSVRAV